MSTANLISLLGYDEALQFIAEKIEKGETVIKSISEDKEGKIIVRINI
jgi:hypothetical protein